MPDEPEERLQDFGPTLKKAATDWERGRSGPGCLTCGGWILAGRCVNCGREP